MLPSAFTAMHKGDGPTQVQGESLYGRGLSMKIRVTFPTGADTLLGDHPIYLIHGFVRAPMFPERRASLSMDTDGSGAIDQSEVMLRLPPIVKISRKARSPPTFSVSFAKISMRKQTYSTGTRRNHAVVSRPLNFARFMTPTNLVSKATL
jgi:hypothetical protein